MEMESWVLLWKITIIAAIGLFAGLAVVVSIGGYFDIKELFKSLKEDLDRENE